MAWISTAAKAAASYAVNKSVNSQDSLSGLFTRLATAVTQVVMLRCGELRVAVPSTLIEIVRRVPVADHVFQYARDLARARGHAEVGEDDLRQILPRHRRGRARRDRRGRASDSGCARESRLRRLGVFRRRSARVSAVHAPGRLRGAWHTRRPHLRRPWRGAPLAPLPRVPAAVQTFTANRRADVVELFDRRKESIGVEMHNDTAQNMPFICAFAPTPPSRLG